MYMMMMIMMVVGDHEGRQICLSRQVAIKLVLKRHPLKIITQGPGMFESITVAFFLFFGLDHNANRSGTATKGKMERMARTPPITDGKQCVLQFS